MYALKKQLNSLNTKTRIPPSDANIIAAMKAGIKFDIFPSTSRNLTEVAQHPTLYDHFYHRSISH